MTITSASVKGEPPAWIAGKAAQLLARLLDDMGFKAQAISDLVRGRLVKYSREDTERIWSRWNFISFFPATGSGPVQ